MKQIDGQLPLFEEQQPGNFEEQQPGNCPNEGAVADIGGGKSYCIPWERYTNCREVGYCVFAKYGGEE